ncbi:hypothetical protein Verru16b_02954 [Lacunisphaera limnophila]|uniref:Uncharacterized protein n=1 Tax=Lacunisphaera limnophila TaxID=1838286 RepID=A0A1D8AY90_9BACT|nr:ACT domain-containing protein [Lacunisphaera limnophila]AOS45863.1 hypothetical protein Verru16b_02954 [Lacunisphaera limnophila]
MDLTLEPAALTICQLPADADLPEWLTPGRGFLSITRTGEELSIVCAAELVPAAVRQQPGWQAFKIAGPLDFALTGILASVLGPLARAGVSIFTVSTFDTDYVLVPASRLPEAIRALTAAGHTIARS